MAQGRYAHPRQKKPPRSKRPQNSDKRFYLILGLTAAAVAVLTFCTCVLLAQTAVTEPEETSSLQQESSSSVLQISSQEVVSSEEAVSSEEEIDLSSAVPASSNAVTAKAFSENPIDAALDRAVADASNHVQLLNAYETALDAWKNEISREAARLQRLLPDSSAFSAEQAAWEQRTEAEFAASDTDGEGSNVPLERAHAACDAYRARAEKLYARLVEYDPSYQIR